MLEALLLDFYGTLVEEDDAVIARIVAEIAATSRLGASAREIAATWNERFAALCAEAHGPSFRRQREIEVVSLRETLARHASPLDAERLSAALFEYWERPRPVDGAERFLCEVGLPICVVSNIDQHDLDLAVAGLGWSFDAVITSEGCRAYKPRVEPFRAALAALGRAPQQVLHVGDSLGSDVRGATAAGIEVAWINAKARALPANLAPPRHVVASLDELSVALRAR